METTIYLLIILLIFISTFISSLGGLGAAFIIIPILIAFGYPIEQASIYGLTFNFINTFTVSTRNYRQKSINFRVSVPIILMSLIGAPVGALLVNYIPSNELKFVFACVLILIGANTIIKQFKSGDSALETDKDVQTQLLFSITVGFLVGFVSGLLGIGGGAIVLPLLLYFNLRPKKAAGTTSFIVVFSSFVGIISKLLINNYIFDYILIFYGTMVSIIAALLGSYAMHFRLKQSQIKMIIALLITLVGIKMIFDYF